MLERLYGSVTSVRIASPRVVLTYDDGPEPAGTDRILSALAEHNATATFFVLQRRADIHRDLLNDVVAAGHEIGLHGPDHVRLTTMPVALVRQRTKDAKNRLEDLTGRSVRWFRPPYGAQRIDTWAAVRTIGMHPVLWSHAAGDWTDEPVDQFAERALRDIHHGAIVLMHDGYAGPADGVDDGPAPLFDRGELTRRVLSGLAERGLAAASLGDALTSGAVVRQVWFSN